ncbi:MAG: hypothetical protein QMC83_10250 [Thermodesulfovibrionales bacterium]|nr:hypothetical protein [Thermodesulfovibrionales bacterium]
MKLKGILKGNELNLPSVAILKKPEVEVEVEIPDEDIELLTDEEIEKMSLSELAKLIWKGKDVDNRDYKEIVGEALAAKYRGEL